MSTDLEKYKEIYINDMREHLEHMNRSLVDLEHDPGNLDLLNEIFRAAHTIKGNSATMEYHDVAGLAHIIENLLDGIRNNQLSGDGEVMDTLFKGLDTLESMIEAIASDQEVPNPDNIIKKVEEILQRGSMGSEEPAREVADNELSTDELRLVTRAMGSGKAVYEIQVTIDENCILKSARAIILIRNLEKFGEKIAVRPPEEQIKQTNPDKFMVILASEADIELLRESALNVPEISDVKITRFDDEEETQEFDLGAIDDMEIIEESPPKNEVHIPQNDAKNDGVKDDGVKDDGVKDDGVKDDDVKDDDVKDDDVKDDDVKNDDVKNGDVKDDDVKDDDAKNDNVKDDNVKDDNVKDDNVKDDNVKDETRVRQVPQSLTSQNIRVNISHLDSLMNRVGELVINKIGLEHIIQDLDNPQLNELVGQLNRIVEDLQEEVMKIRMVPVANLFSKYPRIVRDLSRNNNKKVKLVVEGGDIELDRTVLDGIKDPLIHILRNSIDHGIETPRERQRKGKPEEGTVLLRANRKKNHVIIEISDDGAGIEPEVIKKSAIARGLITEEEASAMGADELISLIFLPGFSTSRTITDISGRGVGMDVVRRDVERLGGTVSIESSPGEGTRLELKLPLTLAIVKGLEVRVGSENYVLPLNNVVESIRVDPDKIKMVDKQENYVLDGRVIPMVRLNLLFDIESSPEDNVFMVIVEHESGLLGLVVDELVGQQEVVIKTLGDSLGHVQGFAGATIIKNGKVALIIDTNSLLRII